MSDACIQLSKVHIYGAIFQFEGQLSVFNYQGGPNYKDLYSENNGNNNREDTCSNSGVLGLLPGIIGNLQATETIKIILGYKSILSGIILEYDALTLSFKKFKVINTSFLLEKSKWECENALIEQGSKLEEINVLQLQKILNIKNSQYLLIDVRSREEYKSSHLASSLNIPLGQLEKSQYSILDLKKKICFIYCSLDSRSIFASNYLIKQKLRIIRVKGGLNAWHYLITKSTL